MSMESGEKRELDLVGKVELRFALADSDAKLERLLTTYLAPLLLKLDSEHASVKAKVVDVCQHINIRLQSPSIKLPVEALLKQVKSKRESSMLRHFDLTYIQKGVSRLSDGDKAALLPAVITGIKADFDQSPDYGAEMFNLFLRLLQEFPLPQRGSKEDEGLREALGLTPDDAACIAHWIGRLTLLNRIRHHADVEPTCPGLNITEIKILTLLGKRDAFDPSAPNGLNLVTTKAKAVAFLASNAFKHNERFISAVCASANANSDISDIADGILKRSASSVDLEDRAVLNQLVALFTGGTDSAATLAPHALRRKVLSYLGKSSAIIDDPQTLETLVNGGLHVDPVRRGCCGVPKVPSREAGLLRLATVKFVNSAMQTATSRGIALDAQSLVNRFLAVLLEQGWPVLKELHELDFRQQVYQVIGSAGAVGKSSETQLLVLRFLLLAYATDNSGQETGLEIQRALLTMMRSFWLDKTDAETKSRLSELLLEIGRMGMGEPIDVSSTVDSIKELITVDTPKHDMAYDGALTSYQLARSPLYIVNRIANRCLDYDSLDARWINVLAAGAGREARPETLDEGRRGLDPHWFQTTNSDIMGAPGLKLPTMVSFVNSIGKHLTAVDANGTSMDVDWDENDPAHVVFSLQESRPATIPPLVKYLRQLLLSEALSNTCYAADFANAEWLRKLDSALQNSKDAKDTVRKYLESQWSHASERFSLSVFYKLLAMVALWDQENVASDSLQMYTQFLTVCPDGMLRDLSPDDDLKRLVTALESNNRARRDAAAHAYGLLASLTEQPFRENMTTTLTEPWRDAIGARINEIHGHVSAVAYAISRMSHRGRGSDVQDSVESLLKLVVDLLLNAQDATLQDAASAALIQLFAYKVVTPASFTKHMSIQDAVEKLVQGAKKGQERAIAALGRFTLVFENVEDEAEASALQTIEDALHSLHEMREMELQFAVGEAFSLLACGWESSAMAPTLDIAGPLPLTAGRAALMNKVLTRVIGSSKMTKPALKRAAIIWLLCLVQFGGHRAEIKDRLRSCQDAFKHCLSDREELVQEAASRGLGLVYEKGDRNLKDDLIRDLVGTFTDSKPSTMAGNVTEETELFEPGALPTGDGQSVSTYKDVISLAQEVGDPSLVYRFMSLAANNAIWSSRAAFGRFGLSNIFSDSGVEGYLADNPKLYPKLYRYRFDPNSNVRRSMNDIWNALVKDSNATVDANFNAIMDDVLKSMLGKEWRTRQASCDATAELVQGRAFEKVEPYMGSIWTHCFKVLDDIKLSVRMAAANLARTLTGILMRTLEAGEGSAKKADAMLKHVLPFLLSSSGVESRAEETMIFALDTLLRIIKNGSGKILRPRIPELMERLLPLFSSMESELATYLRFKAKEYKLTEQKIDDARLRAVRQSPLMEAVEKMLDLTDEATMALVAPKLEDAIKSSLGLPSQVACARVLVSMSTRHNQIFRPYADGFLSLASRHLTDRNDSVALSYAEAAGYVARVASDAAVLDLFARARALYFDAGDDRHAVAAGDVVFAVATHATDRFASLGADVYPLVFVAMHDGSARVRDRFEKTWSDNVGASRAVLLYLKEIVELAARHLDSARWAVKHASARAVAAAATAAAGAGTEDMELAHAETLWPALVKAMGGKTWEGKEAVLEAFVKFVEKGGRLWRENSTVAAEITKIMTREAKRDNVRYRPFAVGGIGMVAAARTDISMMDAVFDVAGPLIEELAGKETDDMDVDGATEEAKLTAEVREQTVANAVEALQACIRGELLKGSGGIAKLMAFLELAAKAYGQLGSRTVACAVYRAVDHVSGKLTRPVLELVGARERETAEKMWGLVEVEGTRTKAFGAAPEAFRLERAKAAKAVVEVAWSEEVKRWARRRMEDEVGREKSSVVRQAYGVE